MSGTLVNKDCMEHMMDIDTGSIDLVLTDISNKGLHSLIEGEADLLLCDLSEFLQHIYRITKDILTVFCDYSLYHKIHSFFSNSIGTTKTLIWKQTYPNRTVIDLSKTKLAIWVKKKRNYIYPPQVDYSSIEELIRENTREDELIYDPCAGKGDYLLEAMRLKRRFLGCEINREYYEIAQQRLTDYMEVIYNGDKSQSV